MSGLGNFALLPGRKELSAKDLNLSDDDFDAMLDDMLDSPTMKGPTVSSKQKNQSSNRELTDNKNDSTSLDSSRNSESFSQVATTKSLAPTHSGFGGKLGDKNSLDQSNDLFIDSDEDAIASIDDLDDSILGGMLKSKIPSTKQSINPKDVISPASPRSSSNSKSKGMKDSRGSAAVNMQPNQIDIDSSMQDDWDGSDSMSSPNKVDKLKDKRVGGKLLSKDLTISSTSATAPKANRVRLIVLILCLYLLENFVVIS